MSLFFPQSSDECACQTRYSARCKEISITPNVHPDHDVEILIKLIDFVGTAREKENAVCFRVLFRSIKRPKKRVPGPSADSFKVNGEDTGCKTCFLRTNTHTFYVQSVMNFAGALTELLCRRKFF